MQEVHNIATSQTGFMYDITTDKEMEVSCDFPTGADETNFQNAFISKGYELSGNTLYPIYYTTGSSSDTIALKTSDETNLGIVYADVAGTGLAVDANSTYEFEFNIIADSSGTTVGIDVACNGPAGATVNYTQGYWTSATAFTERGANTYDNNTASTASNGGSSRIFRVKGILITGIIAGTLIARAKREASGSGPNVRAGSYGRARKIS